MLKIGIFKITAKKYENINSYDYNQTFKKESGFDLK